MPGLQMSTDSKSDLLRAIRQSKDSNQLRSTMKKPNQVLERIHDSGESIESLARKIEVSEREILLAIQDDFNKSTRAKIADELNMTFFSLFGK